MQRENIAIETAYWGGLLALVSLPFRADGVWGWATLILATHIALTLVVTVGNHRLFCHNSFKTSTFWRRFLAFASVLTVFGSPILWAITHSEHHKKSDTPLDPNPEPKLSKLLLRLGYRGGPTNIRSAARLMRDPVQTFVHRHYFKLLAVGLVLMGLFSTSFLLNAYLPAIGLLHLTSRLHLALTHHGNKPRNLYLLEYIFPASGEWQHAYHHNHPGDFVFGHKWYHLDLGALFISAIRTRA